MNAIQDETPDESKSQRVVITTLHFPPDQSGNASRMHDMATNLVDESWDVSVVTAPPAFPHGQFDRVLTREKQLKRDGLDVRWLWTWQPTTEDPGFVSRLAYYLGFAIHAALWLLFHGDEYDIVYTTSPPIFTGLVGLVSKFVHRTPWFVDVRDLWIEASISLGFISEGTLVERASRLFENVSLSSADGVTVTTETSKAHLTREYGIDPSGIHHIPNGVDTDLFSPPDEGADSDLGSDPDSPLLIYTGNVGHAQDLHVFVRAMAHLDRDDVTLRIVGEGDAKPELKRLASELDVEDTVEFRGLVPRETVPELLGGATVGVAPLKESESFEYAIPTKVYEYMSCELPVLVTGVGEIEDFVDRTEAGVAADSDPARLARTIADLLKDDEARSAMGRNGRRHVLENYERSVITKRLSDHFRSEITEPDRPEPVEHEIYAK